MLSILFFYEVLLTKNYSKLSQPLIEAVSTKDSDQVNCLLSQGADANTTNETGYSVLQLSVWLVDLQITELLIKYGADINYINRSGNTSLHIATWYGKRKEENISADEKSLLQQVEVLLAQKADPNLVNYFGMTALHHAAYYGYASIVKTLIQFGANQKAGIQPHDIQTIQQSPHWREFETTGLKIGMKPLEIAEFKNHSELVGLLV